MDRDKTEHKPIPKQKYHPGEITVEINNVRISVNSYQELLSLLYNNPKKSYLENEKSGK